MAIIQPNDQYYRGDKQLHWDCSWFWKMWNFVGTASLLPGSTQQWECSHLDGARLFPMSPQRWADNVADQIQLTQRAAGCPLLLRLWENTTKKNCWICFCHFLSVPFPSWFYEQLGGLTWVQKPGFVGHLLPQRADVPHPDRALVCRVARRDLHLVVFFERALPLRHDLQPAGLR